MSIIEIGQARPERMVGQEEEIRRKLKELDSLLDIKWMPYAYWNQKGEDYEGRYALICQWPQVDKRWEMIRTGEIGEPFDMLGWFCEDVHSADTVPVEPMQMMDLVIELLGKCDNTREGWKSRLQRAMEANRAREKEVMDLAKEEGLDTMKYYQKQIAGESFVGVEKTPEES
jgi:hypothetical protein